MELIHILLIIVGVIIFIGVSVAMSAGANYKNTVKKYTNDTSDANYNSADFARKELAERKIDVQVVRVEGQYADMYDSANKVLALSSKNYSSYSVVSAAVTAHEVGHAIQHNTNSGKFNAYWKLRKFVKFLNPFFWIALVASIVCWIAIPWEPLVAISLIGVSGGIFVISLILKFILISVEKEASNYGVEILKSNNYREDDIKVAKKLYRAALTTYIADIFMPIVKLIDGIGWVIHNTLGRLFR